MKRGSFGRTFLRPALAAQRACRLRPGLFRRDRFVGHRLLQLRPYRQNLSVLKAWRRGDVTYWKGVTSLVQNAGSVLGIYFFQRPHLLHRPPAGLRRLLPGRDPRHGRHVLVLARP